MIFFCLEIKNNDMNLTYKLTHKLFQHLKGSCMVRTNQTTHNTNVVLGTLFNVAKQRMCPVSCTEIMNEANFILIK